MLVIPNGRGAARPRVDAVDVKLARSNQSVGELQ
jgi:hypothetical protein